jgi:hypothetical protein
VRGYRTLSEQSRPLGEVGAKFGASIIETALDHSKVPAENTRKFQTFFHTPVMFQKDRRKSYFSKLGA